MKAAIRNICRITILGLMLPVANTTLLARSTLESITTTTNSSGTISTFSRDMIAIRSTATSDPVIYSCTKSTAYIDENGVPVLIAVVKSGLPVTIYYTIAGERMIASKVVVRRVVSTDAKAPEAGEKTTGTPTAGEKQ